MSSTLSYIASIGSFGASSSKSVAASVLTSAAPVSYCLTTSSAVGALKASSSVICPSLQFDMRSRGVSGPVIGCSTSHSQFSLAQPPRQACWCFIQKSKTTMLVSCQHAQTNKSEADALKEGHEPNLVPLLSACNKLLALTVFAVYALEGRLWSPTAAQPLWRGTWTHHPAHRPLPGPAAVVARRPRG